MRCPRCLNGFVMTTYLGTDYEDVFCVNCAWRYHPPFVETPMRTYSLCWCGEEISSRYEVCSKHHAERIRKGRLAAEEARKVSA